MSHLRRHGYYHQRTPATRETERERMSRVSWIGRGGGGENETTADSHI